MKWKKTSIYLAFTVILTPGCGPQEKPAQLKVVNESLERINNTVKEENRILIETLLQKEKDPQMATVISRWLPRVNKIHQYSDSLIKMIENIKSELFVQSDSLEREYVPVVKQLVDVNGEGNVLFKKLAVFKDSIPSLTNLYGSMDGNHLRVNIPLLPGYGDSLLVNDQVHYGEKWLDKSFGRHSSLMTMIMLNKLENDVLATEKMLIEYCNSNYCELAISYSKYQGLAVLSSSYVRQGQPIEVTAGVGGFSGDARPRITISGKEVELNNEGTAVYRFIADGNPGKHSTTVSIDFIEPNGYKAHMSKRLEYIIADEK